MAEVARASRIMAEVARASRIMAEVVRDSLILKSVLHALSFDRVSPDRVTYFVDFF